MVEGTLRSINSSSLLYQWKTKGIVLDLDNKEFNILQNCDDLNDFLSKHDLPEFQCNSETFTIGDLRKKLKKLICLIAKLMLTIY